jgi:hypothetical protein
LNTKNEKFITNLTKIQSIGATRKIGTMDRLKLRTGLTEEIRSDIKKNPKKAFGIASHGMWMRILCYKATHIK